MQERLAFPTVMLNRQKFQISYCLFEKNAKKGRQNAF